MPEVIITWPAASVAEAVAANCVVAELTVGVPDVVGDDIVVVAVGVDDEFAAANAKLGRPVDSNAIMKKLITKLKKRDFNTFNTP